MSIFTSTWIEGKINNFDELLSLNPTAKFMFILDTNFAIIARDYILEKESFNSRETYQKEEFLKAIKIINRRPTRIIYALACEEAARSKATGNLDIEKYKLMVDCISKIFHKNFNTNLFSENPLITEDIHLTKVPLLLNNGLFSTQSIILYVTILKLYMFKHFDKRDSKTKIKEMFDYTAHEINNFSVASTSLTIHYLGYESSILRNTKPSLGTEKILSKLYAATIDLLLPTKTAQLAEVGHFEEVPIFITFDKGIKLLFDSLLITELHQLENGSVVPGYTTTIFYSSGWKDKEIIELCSYSKQAQRENRKVVDKEAQLQHLYKLAQKLEEELNKKLIERNDKSQE